MYDIVTSCNDTLECEHLRTLCDLNVIEQGNTNNWKKKPTCRQSSPGMIISFSPSDGPVLYFVPHNELICSACNNLQVYSVVG